MARVRKKKSNPVEGKPEPRKFTKDRPCYKIDIWNCFKRRRGFKRVQIDEAHAIIGVNSPKAMKWNGHITKYEEDDVEYYELTELGREWVTKGIKSYMRNHPEDIPNVLFPPPPLPGE